MDDHATLMLVNSKNKPEMLNFDYSIPENASQDEIFTTIGRPVAAGRLEALRPAGNYSYTRTTTRLSPT